MIVLMFQNDELNTPSKYSQLRNVELKLGDELNQYFKIRTNTKV